MADQLLVMFLNEPAVDNGRFLQWLIRGEMAFRGQTVAVEDTVAAITKPALGAEDLWAAWHAIDKIDAGRAESSWPLRFLGGQTRGSGNRGVFGRIR